jgi:hypothetical protein
MFGRKTSDSLARTRGRAKIPKGVRFAAASQRQLGVCAAPRVASSRASSVRERTPSFPYTRER